MFKRLKVKRFQSGLGTIHLPLGFRALGKLLSTEQIFVISCFSEPKLRPRIPRGCVPDERCVVFPSPVLGFFTSNLACCGLSTERDGCRPSSHNEFSWSWNDTGWANCRAEIQLTMNVLVLSRTPERPMLKTRSNLRPKEGVLTWGNLTFRPPSSTRIESLPFVI